MGHHSDYHKNYYQRNKDRLLQYGRDYYQRHKEERSNYYKERNSKYKRKKPWMKHLTLAIMRCYYIRHKDFDDYGRKGVTCYLTPSQIEKLWYKYEANLMKEPTLRRMHRGGHFLVDNCCFLDGKDAWFVPKAPHYVVTGPQASQELEDQL